MQVSEWGDACCRILQTQGFKKNLGLDFTIDFASNAVFFACAVNCGFSEYCSARLNRPSKLLLFCRRGAELAACLRLYKLTIYLRTTEPLAT